MAKFKDIEGSILDIGTGSGIIAIYAAMLSKFKNGIQKLNITGTEYCEAAFSTAEDNAFINGVKFKDLIVSNLLDSIDIGRFYSLMTCNYPALPGNKEEQKEYPANIGGEDGLKFPKELLTKGIWHLQEGGNLLIPVSEHPDFSELEKILKTYWKSWEFIGEKEIALTEVQKIQLKKRGNPKDKEILKNGHQKVRMLKVENGGVDFLLRSGLDKEDAYEVVHFEGSKGKISVAYSKNGKTAIIKTSEGVSIIPDISKIEGIGKDKSIVQLLGDKEAIIANDHISGGRISSIKNGSNPFHNISGAYVDRCSVDKPFVLDKQTSENAKIIQSASR